MATTSATANNGVRQGLKEFGPIGITSLVVILLIGPAWFRALLVLAWAKLSRTPYREIGFVRPRSWPITVLSGLILGITFKVIMKALVMPLFGAPPVNQAYHFLAGNNAALPGMLFTLTIGAGFGEETVFRGYLFERCRTIFGDGRAATILTVLITSVIFATAHYVDQSWPGVEQALITGTIFGMLFVFAGNLWLPMIVHAAFDLTALAMIYWNLESQIAHLFFK